jgi:hypothetical protein
MLTDAKPQPCHLIVWVFRLPGGWRLEGCDFRVS